MNDRYPLLKFLLFAGVCLAFAGWLIAVMGNLSFEGRTGYSAVFSDAQGLLVNDAVKVSGVTVGKVTGIQVVDGRKARVDFEVRDDVALGDQTEVAIRWRDVIGLRFLYVLPAGDGRLEPGTTIPDERTVEPADIGLLLERLTPVMRALDPERGNQVIEALAEALVGREHEIQQLIAEGASLTSALADREDTIASLLRNAGTVLEAYNAREDQLRGLLDSFAGVADTVADRNDTLVSAVVALADSQEELARLVDANDEEIADALDALDVITGVLAVNHDNLERALTHTGRGLISYHRISSLGQWFNIRAVGFGSEEETFNSERSGSPPSACCERDEDINFIDRDGPEGGDGQVEGEGSQESAALAQFFLVRDGGR